MKKAKGGSKRTKAPEVSQRRRLKKEEKSK
jgi:hypothetical protein